ncbi:MAG TPA: tautomerase family protein [Steroidobacteraceae bacterium]|jgi:phenylpyruvate tautomerase PptA (4-oxalocrotonate tautomerase family)
MPLVRISLREGKSAQYRRAVADGVHAALVEAEDWSFGNGKAQYI